VTVAVVEFNTTDRRENTMRLTKKRGAAGGAALIAVLVLVLALNVLPSSAQTPPAPIATEFLTARATFTDDVDVKFKLTLHGLHKQVVKVKDPSRTVVARYTVQPGAQFPWHSHRGPVVVTIVSGELTYIPADDCKERTYPAGTSFVDPGQGHVHSAKNATSAPTVFVATFFAAPADGPLLIPAEQACP
jgi:quercetin dioxygenase-like cupin family protein